MTIEELKAKLAELTEQVKSLKERADAAYTAGLRASREFDEQMDGFLINFLRKPYSHIVVFAVALGLCVVSGFLGSLL